MTSLKIDISNRNGDSFNFLGLFVNNSNSQEICRRLADSNEYSWNIQILWCDFAFKDRTIPAWYSR